MQRATSVRNNAANDMNDIPMPNYPHALKF